MILRAQLSGVYDTSRHPGLPFGLGFGSGLYLMKALRFMASHVIQASLLGLA